MINVADSEIGRVYTMCKYSDRRISEGAIRMENPQLEEINLLHAHICQALSEPRRLQILYALQQEPQRVTDLAERLDIPQPTVSRHLAVLRQRSLVSAERNGSAVIYSLADDRIIEVLDLMRQVLREALERQSSAILPR